MPCFLERNNRHNHGLFGLGGFAGQVERQDNHHCKEKTMSTNQDEGPALETATPQVSPGNYSPVDVTNRDTVGAFMLGLLAVILLIGWMRTEERYRALLARRESGA
jgi:hypothetical protein